MFEAYFSKLNKIGLTLAVLKSWIAVSIEVDVTKALEMDLY